MKKIVVMGLTVLGLFCFAGCNKPKDPNKMGVKQGENGKKTYKFVPEDFILGGGSEVLQTEKGRDRGGDCI